MNASIPSGNTMFETNFQDIAGLQAAIEQMRSIHRTEAAPVSPLNVVPAGKEAHRVFFLGAGPKSTEWFHGLFAPKDNIRIVAVETEKIASSAEAEMPRLIVADENTFSINGRGCLTARQLGIDQELPVILLVDDTFRATDLPTDAGVIDYIRRSAASAEIVTRVGSWAKSLEETARLRSKNEAIQQELELKNRELFLHLELLMHSGSVKDKMVEGIHRLQPFLNQEGKSKLATLLKQFRWELNDEATINFARAFDDLHASLYTRLEKLCPRITRGEKRLCAFVIKDHSSADISRITRKSQNSINVAFSRLRSKLGLSNSKNLRTFLETLSVPSIQGFSFSNAIMSVPAPGNSFRTGFNTLQSA